MRMAANPGEDMSDSSGPVVDSTGSGSARTFGRTTGSLAPKPTESEAARIIAELERQVRLLARQNTELENTLQEERAQRRAAETYTQNLQAVAHFAKEFEALPDAEQAARAMIKVIVRHAACDLAAIYQLVPGEERMKLLASAGSTARLLPRSFTNDLAHPLVAQALDVLHPCSTSQNEASVPPFALNGFAFASLLAVPITRRGGLRGLILLADAAPGSFTAGCCSVLESAVETLASVWEYTHRTDALTDLVGAIAHLSYVQKTGSLMERIGAIARETLQARFAVVAIHTRDGWEMRPSGEAPLLFDSLQHGAESFLIEALNTPHTIRLSDLRSEPRSAGLRIDTPELRSMLFSPIRGGTTTTGIRAEGLLVVFGKQGEPAFSNEDVRMAELLATRAAINLESAFLNQQLQENLETTQQLYTLSQQIANVKDLRRAAWAIVRTTHSLTKARRCGMVVYSLDGQERKVEICMPSKGSRTGQPEALIAQAMQDRRTLTQPNANGLITIVVPIQSKHLSYGALWMETHERPGRSEPAEEVRAVVNEAAQTVERMFLLEETREQARTLERTNRQLAEALRELEQSYDQTIQALMHALDARDSETEDHSWRVTELSVWLGTKMGLSVDDLRALRRGAMLHDLGKIGIRDHVLLKPGRLNADEWEEMRKHPENGVEIIRTISPLSDAIPVIIAHQERWDGSGYPRGLQGEEIPLLARIFAVIDVYDALTSKRVYRDPQPREEALEYLDAQAGVHFDPHIVSRFTHLMRTDPPAFEV